MHKIATQKRPRMLQCLRLVITCRYRIFFHESSPIHVNNFLLYSQVYRSVVLRFFLGTFAAASESAQDGMQLGAYSPTLLQMGIHR